MQLLFICKLGGSIVSRDFQTIETKVLVVQPAYNTSFGPWTIPEHSFAMCVWIKTIDTLFHLLNNLLTHI